MSRRLLVVPIIHSGMELGSELETHRAGIVARHGEAGWEARQAAVADYWRAVRDALLALPIDFRRLKVYQDSLPDGPGVERLIEELARGGSPNHQLLLTLRARGAAVLGTESLALLLEEYQAIKAQRADVPFLRRSLEARDRYVAERIGVTLGKGENGILFIGAAHDVRRFIDRDIDVALLSSEPSQPRNAP